MGIRALKKLQNECHIDQCCCTGTSVIYASGIPEFTFTGEPYLYGSSYGSAPETAPASKVRGAHLGPVGPKWAPCWPHERCYQGRLSSKLRSLCVGNASRTQKSPDNAVFNWLLA